MTDLFDNPMGLMGFEFVEFASPDAGRARALLEKLGFTLVARHRSKDVVLYRQGGINFIVNREPKQRGRVLRRRARAVGLRPGVSRQGFAPGLCARAGAGRAAAGDAHRPMELRLPAIKGIGGAPLYLIDRFEEGQVDLRHRLRVHRRRGPPSRATA
jgi:4-hydroxyphenylpyruvate dioxygenase